MAQKYKQLRGFTIVELLIVIVVIGILAAIVINSFTGTQARAENTKTIEGVKSYAKALQAYKAETGGNLIATNYPCLGVIAGGTCSRVSGSTTCNGAGGTSVDSIFDAALQPYLGANKPELSTQRVTCNGSSYLAGYYISSSDGINSELTYYLRGNVACGVIGGTTIANRFQNDGATMCTNKIN